MESRLNSGTICCDIFLAFAFFMPFVIVAVSRSQASHKKGFRSQVSENQWIKQMSYWRFCFFKIVLVVVLVLVLDNCEPSPLFIIMFRGRGRERGRARVMNYSKLCKTLPEISIVLLPTIKKWINWMGRDMATLSIPGGKTWTPIWQTYPRTNLSGSHALKLCHVLMNAAGI